MKNKLFPLFGLLLAGSLLLSGCAQGLMPASWPGIGLDDKAAPSVAYVAAGASVYAVDLSDGSEIWNFPVKAQPTKPFFATPMLTSDGQLIVAGYDYGLYSLDPSDGSINWKFSGARDRYIGSVLVSGDMIYAPNADYKLYALNLEGELQWSFEAEQSFWSPPVADGKTLFIGSLDRKLYALDASSGEKVWQKDLGAAILCSPVTGTDLPLFVAAFDGSLLALDKSTGDILWQESYDGRLWSTPALQDGLLYFGDDLGVIRAVDASNGSLVWSDDIGSAILGSLLATPEGLYFGTEAGDLYAYGLDGKKLWNDGLNVDSDAIKLYGTPVLAGANILLAPVVAVNFLIAYDQSGDDVWSFKPAK
jgi:eukaryotic-like serine/threonine-protein kinase